MIIVEYDSYMNLRNMKNSGKKKLIVILVGVIFAVVMILHYVPVFVKINGEKKMYVEAGSFYTDEGAVNRFTGEILEAQGNVDTSLIGEYEITYQTFLQKMSRVVTVQDTTAPVIKLQGRDIMIAAGCDYIDEGVTVSDNYDHDLEGQVTVSSDVDKDKAGVYSIIYDVTDRSGNQAESLIRNVYVYDDDFSYVSSADRKDLIDEEAMEAITSFLDRYYRALKYLEHSDLSDHFDEGNEELAYLVNAAVDALIDFRKDVYNDLRMDECSYDLDLRYAYKITYDTIRVCFVESSQMKFHFLDTETKQGGVWNYFDLRKQEDGSYKIIRMQREEGVLLYFSNAYLGRGKEEIDQIAEEYRAVIRESQDRYEKERTAVNEGKVSETLDCEYAYDREKAAAYAKQYAVTRNPDFSAYESNCVNFVSQCMHAGGIPMDDQGYERWYFYTGEDNVSSYGRGYTYSWTYIPSFIDYLENGNIVCDLDAGLYEAQKGDVIAIDIEDAELYESPHVLIVSDVIRDENGDIIDILFCGNTNDQMDYPVSAMAYPYKKLIRIYGYNGE